MSRSRRTDPEEGPSTSANTGRIFGHAFLQTIMQQGYMLESDAKKLYKRICNVDNDAGYLAFISDIVHNISFSGFELRRGKWPGNNQDYLGFVNVASDEPSKRASRFRTKDGKPDIRYTAYFRALLERIAGHSGSSEPGGQGTLGWITVREADNINLALTAMPEGATQRDGDDDDGAGPSQIPTTQLAGAAGKAFNLQDKQDALRCFVSDGWLAATPGEPSCYSLGPRAYLELGQLLLDMDMEPGPKAALERALGF